MAGNHQAKRIVGFEALQSTLTPTLPWHLTGTGPCKRKLIFQVPSQKCQFRCLFQTNRGADFQLISPQWLGATKPKDSLGQTPFKVTAPNPPSVSNASLLQLLNVKPFSLHLMEVARARARVFSQRSVALNGLSNPPKP